MTGKAALMLWLFNMYAEKKVEQKFLDRRTN